MLTYCAGKSRAMRKISLALLFVLPFAAGAIAPAAAQDLDLQYRQRTEERLYALESQLRDMTGQIERLQWRLAQSEKRVQALEAALAGTSGAAASGGAATAPGSKPAAPLASGAPAPSEPDRVGGTLPTGDAQAEYDAAYGLLGQGKFAAGEAAFRTFVKRHPDHQLADNARYWIAETLYARQSYQPAATAFLENWQADPQGPKAADNLLKLGMSLQRLDKTNEACASFAKLLSDYRGAPDRVRGAASRERAALGCS